MGYLLNLDDPGPQWLPPTDYKPSDRSTPKISGISQFLKDTKQDSTANPRFIAEPTRTKLQVQIEERKKRRQQQRDEHNRQCQAWKTRFDSYNTKSDPYCTVILARLDYRTTSDEIEAALSKYGPIESVKIIKNGDKPRGYAFVAFQSPPAAKHAIESNGGEMLLGGKRVILDLERGRLQRNWRPRRLGGGEGGRFTISRQKAEIVRHENILRHGLHLPSNNNSNKERSRERDQLRDRRSVQKRPFNGNNHRGNDYRDTRANAADAFYGTQRSYDQRGTNNYYNNNTNANANANANTNANANANANTGRGSARQLRQY